MNSSSPSFFDAAGIEGMLASDGEYASVTRGRSMWPLFKTHRDVVIVRVPSERLKKYDVALYKIGENYVLHRVIGVDVKRGVYKIRGDNTYKNEYVGFDRVLARLVAYNRKGRHRDVTDSSYLIYSRFWHYIYPLRFLMHHLRRLLKGAIRRIIKNKD